MEIRAAIAVDWSGARVGGGRRIWLAEVNGDKLVAFQNRWNRESLLAWLIARAERDPVLVLGLDFAFSFPAWFVTEHLGGTAEATWQQALANGESWLEDGASPFWGRAGAHRPVLEGDRAHFRATEEALAGAYRRPKSVFQVGGAGAVGTGSIRGMPLLARLRKAGFAVWPFDSPALPLVVEIYPRALTGPVIKSDPGARRQYLDAWKWPANPAVRANVAETEDGFDAAVSARQMVLHAIEFGDLPAPSELEQIEGRIWVPEPTRYQQTTAPPPEGIALAVTPSPMETTRMEAADVIRVVGILADAGIECWLDGGWGVDALVGRQTRPHEDLDLVVAMSDISASIGALEGKGFAMKEDLRPCSFTMVTRDHRKVDIHPVIWDDEGGGVQAQPNNSTWTYPARGFHGVGRVDGETLRCLTAEVQIQCHAGYDLDASDLQDLAALRSVLTDDSPNAKASLA